MNRSSLLSKKANPVVLGLLFSGAFIIVNYFVRVGALLGSPDTANYGLLSLLFFPVYALVDQRYIFPVGLLGGFGVWTMIKGNMKNIKVLPLIVLFIILSAGVQWALAVYLGIKL